MNIYRKHKFNNIDIFLKELRCYMYVLCLPFQGVQFQFFPIFRLKPLLFLFLAGEAKICSKIENGIIL